MAESAKEQKVTVDLEQDKAPAKSTQSGALTRFAEMERDLERMFDQFMSGGFRFPFRRDWPSLRWPVEGKSPRVDVVERDDEIIVRAELPGVDKKDLDVSLTDNSVTIKASTSKEEREEEGEYFRQEISRGYLARTIPLPAGVNGSACKAEFKNGLLELRIPKQEKAKRVQIEVK
jgi:HSP20 family protein